MLPADPWFRACAGADSVLAACAGLVDDLVDAGHGLPSVYLLSGRRLRCVAARGYFQVVDGFTPDHGVIGSVVASGRSQLVQDVSSRPDYIGATPGLVAEACSPIVSAGSVVGAVSLEARTGLSPDVLLLLDAAARALGDRIAVLGGPPPLTAAAILAQRPLSAAEELDVPAIERRALAVAVEMARLSSAALVREGTDGLAVTGATGPLAGRMSSWSSDELGALASWVSAGSSSHFPGDGAVPAEHEFLSAAGVRTVSVYPLRTGDRADGWLVLADTLPVGQDLGVAELVEVLADQTAAAVRLAALLEERSRELNVDALTGLGNRAHFVETTQALLDARRRVPRRVGLLLLDVDDFRHVNDALGHEAGDLLLAEVALRVKGCLRAGDVACRLGGDEFAVVMPDVGHGTAVSLAERVMRAVNATLRLAGSELAPTVSIGIAVSGPADTATDQLLRAADLAMYLAKERGKGRYALYEPQMQDAALRRLSLLSDLRKALQEDTLRMVYQPIVALPSGTMTGLEALLRWDRPGHGPVSPAEFIPLAEESGLIGPLGDWVLRQSCAQLALWDELGADPQLRMSVNVSTRQLEGGSLLQTLDACLDGGLAPSRLILEITETALSLDSSAARQTLLAIRNRGVHLAVDDFGTGYSSLGLLRSAPVSRLKIDRQFVAEIADATTAVPLVDATIAMARGLGLGLVAEGVETPAQLSYLLESGCAEVQGYLLARPLEVPAVSALVRGARPWSGSMHDQASPHQNGRAGVGGLMDLAMSPDVDFEALVRPLLRELESITGLEMTYLTTVDAERTEQRVELVRAPSDSFLREGLTVPWEDTVCSRALTAGPRRTADAQGSFPDAAAARELNLRGYIVEPVFWPSGEFYGTLCGLSHTSVEPTEAHTATMRLFARLVTDKIRQTIGPSVGPVGDEPLPAPAGSEALASRRAAGRRTWEQERQRRERAARDALRAAPAGVQAPRALDRLARVHAAVLAHAEQLPGAATRSGAGRRVLIADDDSVIRQIVAAFVEAHPGLRLAGQHASGADVIGAAIAEQPDLVVLDFDLGDLTAHEVIPDLRTFAPGARILLHSSRTDVFQMGQQLGVDRTVYKGDALDRLVEALDALAG